MKHDKTFVLSDIHGELIKFKELLQFWKPNGIEVIGTIRMKQGRQSFLAILQLDIFMIVMKSG
ncbi:hypothetical protein [Bacillus pumilus]|uniref:hypothetical protein n=1 Tax=Bacillus pumilus TaxID=1408 RepID=UPI0011A4BF38|nr:hypothetical protein [Bacillus pumilus]